LKDFTRKVIVERSVELEKTLLQTHPVDENKNKKPKRLAFLDLLLSMKEEHKLTTEDISEEVDTFMFAGHDTTATSISWAVYCIGSHPEVQRKVLEEMQSIFGDSNRDPTADDLKEMRYLDCAIKESMRLFTPVPWIGRQVSEEFVIGKYTMPKGSNVNVLPYYIHRDKSVYGEDAEEFRPERFQTEEIAGRNPYAYVPFSAGPRNCIGQKFAMMEEKVVLSWIVRAFEIKSIQKRNEVREVFDLILRPSNGILLNMFPRK